MKIQLQTLRKTIIQRDNEICLLKSGLNNGNYIGNNNNPNYIGNNYFTNNMNNFQNNFILNFSIQDSQENYSIQCNKNDIFAKIEEKLYERFPRLRETDNFFLFKGRKILRFKTIAENEIENDSPILLIVFSDRTIIAT